MHYVPVGVRDDVVAEKKCHPIAYLVFDGSKAVKVQLFDFEDSVLEETTDFSVIFDDEEEK